MLTPLMRRAGGLLAAIVVACGVLALVPPRAYAASDVVRNLETTYAIGADGVVKVTQRIDWRFGQSGRRGIKLRIATRERWDADPSKDAVYRISNVAVDSPTGAPDRFTVESGGSGSTQYNEVTVGDPAQTVQGNDQTYVLSYDLRGALRTFDGQPELHWDVTSEQTPAIERFTVRVTAPGGVARARCASGQEKCAASVTGGAATMTGSASSGSPVTIAAGLRPGAVANAQPLLEDRYLEVPTLTQVAGTTTVSADGRLRVEQKGVWLLPKRTNRHTVRWTVPVRWPYDERRDLVLRRENVSVTVNGAEVVPSVQGAYRREKSRQTDRIGATFSGEGQATVVLSYDVLGAVTAQGDAATLAWPIVGTDLSEVKQATFDYRLPASPTDIACVDRSQYSRSDSDCRGALTVQRDGTSVRLSAAETPLADTSYALITLPAASFSRLDPPLEPGIEWGEKLRSWGTMGGSAGALALLAGAGYVVGRRGRGGDRRFAGTPPGVVARDGTATVAARKNDVIPVRFDPPDLPLVQAGALLQRKYEPEQLAATIVQMAVDGDLRVTSSPLTLVRGENKPGQGTLERSIYAAASKPKDSPEDGISEEKLAGLAEETRGRARKTLQQGPYGQVLSDSRGTRHGVGGRPSNVRRNLLLVAGFVAVMVAAGVFGLVGLIGDFGVTAITFFGVIGLLAGLGLGASTGESGVLTPVGTAMRDQVVGFREYIATAEAEQLNVEADQDIFRRYLPWAVLFGLADRWTQVCQELADAGRLPAVDLSFWSGVATIDGLTRGLADLQRDVSAVSPSSSDGGSGSSGSSGGFFSGGGSGGSSGFSSGSFGGGSGGGGTSMSSW